MKKINWRNLLDSGGVWIALFAFLAVASASNEYFRSPQNLINITRQVSYSGAKDRHRPLGRDRGRGPRTGRCAEAEG